MKNNTITVGNEQELALYASECNLVEWVGALPDSKTLYGAKIRYRQEDQACTLAQNSGVLNVTFKEPQRAISS